MSEGEHQHITLHDFFSDNEKGSAMPKADPILMTLLTTVFKRMLDGNCDGDGVKNRLGGKVWNPCDDANAVMAL